MSQHSRVLLEARERIPGAGARIDGEASRNRQRAILEPLRTQKLVSKEIA
jgi:hypothetical protein